MHYYKQAQEEWSRVRGQFFQGARKTKPSQTSKINMNRKLHARLHQESHSSCSACGKRSEYDNWLPLSKDKIYKTVTEIIKMNKTCKRIADSKMFVCLHYKIRDCRSDNFTIAGQSRSRGLQFLSVKADIKHNQAHARRY